MKKKTLDKNTKVFDIFKCLLNNMNKKWHILYSPFFFLLFDFGEREKRERSYNEIVVQNLIHLNRNSHYKTNHR